MHTHTHTHTRTHTHTHSHTHTHAHVYTHASCTHTRRAYPNPIRPKYAKSFFGSGILKKPSGNLSVGPTWPPQQRLVSSWPWAYGTCRRRRRIRRTTSPPGLTMGNQTPSASEINRSVKTNTLTIIRAASQGFTHDGLLCGLQVRLGADVVPPAGGEVAYATLKIVPDRKMLATKSANHF